MSQIPRFANGFSARLPGAFDSRQLPFQTPICLSLGGGTGSGLGTLPYVSDEAWHELACNARCNGHASGEAIHDGKDEGHFGSSPTPASAPLPSPKSEIEPRWSETGEKD